MRARKNAASTASRRPVRLRSTRSGSPSRLAVAMTLKFGTDGVRGAAGVDLTPELVVALGRAAVRALDASEPFLIARDTRRSGPMLEAALIAGICAEGGSAASLGVLPTPAPAGACLAGRAPGAMPSASHNPYAD